MKKIIVSLALVAGLCAGYLLFIKKSQKNNALIIGIAANYAPWISLNTKNQYEGFDIDVIKAVAQEMNLDLKLKDLGSMSSLLLALDQGKIDAVIWGMSIIPERLEKMAMIHYQGDTISEYPLLFWEIIPSNVTSLTSMNGKVVCVEPASSQDKVLSKYTKVTKLPVDKVDDGLLNLQYKKADALFVEPAIAKKFMRKYPQIKALAIPLQKEDQVQGVGICIKKNNQKLIQTVQAAIDCLTQKKVIQTFEQKWGM